MTRRILTALIIGGGWLVLLFAAPFLIFWGILCLIGAIMAWEAAPLVLRTGETRMKPGIVALMLLPLLASFSGRLEAITAALALAILLLILVTILRHADLPEPLEFLQRSAFGIVLAGFFPAHIVLVMHLPTGPYLLLFLTAITAAADSMALFTGKWLGKHALCPTVSPKKTIEGLLGGLAGGGLAGLLVASLFFAGFSPVKILLYSALLTAVGALGDLTESLLKRAAGVKDSGNILPGHGGLLDRVDSLLLAAPTFYYLNHWHLLFP